LIATIPPVPNELSKVPSALRRAKVKSGARSKSCVLYLLRLFAVDLNCYSKNFFCPYTTGCTEFASIAKPIIKALKKLSKPTIDHRSSLT
jgi:hypothetical protein